MAINKVKLNTVETPLELDLLNVNEATGESSFASATDARGAVPPEFKKLGLLITYYITDDQWYTDQYIGESTSGWSTAANWKALGPVSVSQNTLTIGGEEKGVLMENVQNPEWIDVKVDSEDKILEGTKADGTKYVATDFYVKGKIIVEGGNSDEDDDDLEVKSLSIDGSTIKNIQDAEDRLEIKTDADEKIISHRDKDGVLHENVGIETPKLKLINDGLDELGKALKYAGYGNQTDWSDESFVEIPQPRGCAIINFGVNGQATSKSDRQDYIVGVNGDIPTTIEFWDKDGNYFKKPILLSAQGSSSMAYYIKNQAFDLTDGSKIKIGSWVAQDSFHIKKYYIDIFRGQSIVGYWLIEQMYQTFGYGNIRPWDYLIENNSIKDGLGSVAKDFDTGALAHPDGFPVLVFFNGKCNGLYAFNLKKHRDNYYQKKDKTSNIILDGNLSGSTLWGNTTTIGTVDWEEFEIRNPKPKKKNDGWDLVDVNGEKYNGDFPTELMGTDTQGYDPTDESDVKSAETKASILRLAGALKAIGDNPTKETYEQYFDSKFVIEYYLISNVLFHFDGFAKNWLWCTWDGNVWSPTLYDVDSIFGMHWQGGCIIDDYILGGSANEPTYFMAEDRLYWNDVKARYAELRNNGVFTVNNIVGLLRKWLEHCGYANIKNDINIYAPQTPSYRENLVNSDYWIFLGYAGRVPGGDGSPYDIEKADYAEGDRVTYLDYVYEAKSAMEAGTLPSGSYPEFPYVGGFYNSIQRVKNWLEHRFAVLDSYFQYSSN